MTTFMTISITLTTLFIIVVLVVDHVEVTRQARKSQHDSIQAWKEAYEELQQSEQLNWEADRVAEIKRLVNYTENEEKIMNILSN